MSPSSSWQPSTGLVRDAKHPRAKEGNHKQFEYTAEAWEIVQRQRRTDARIFPYNSKTLSTRQFAELLRALD